MNNLIDIIDASYLDSIQNKLSNKLGISVVISNFHGDRVGQMTDCNDFCKLINSTKKGSVLCNKSKSRFHKMYNSASSSICQCHMGVKNCVHPIMINNESFGNLIIGQFILEEDYNNNLVDTDKISKLFNIDKSKLDLASSEIPILSKDNLKKYLDYSELVCEFLGQIILKNKFHSKVSYLEEEINKEKLKTLESQINPHFLFNTLNSISRMAFLENSPNTIEMVYCLSDLLRYTLDQKEDFPTIEQEINNIKKYLFIQSVRYRDRLKFNIDISDKILNFRIPSMILQPIVENAIMHGIEPKSMGGTIDIYSEFDGGDIKIIVRDTGVGIENSKLLQIQNNNFTNLGIGLSNPHNRLCSYFGESYGLKVNSKKNVETTVEIKFPTFTQLSINKI